MGHRERGHLLPARQQMDMGERRTAVRQDELRLREDRRRAHHRIYTQQIHPAEARKLPLHPRLHRCERRGAEEAGGRVPELLLPRGQGRAADDKVRGSGQDRVRELQRVQLRRRAGRNGWLPGVQPFRPVERNGRLQAGIHGRDIPVHAGAEHRPRRSPGLQVQDSVRAVGKTGEDSGRQL